MKRIISTLFGLAVLCLFAEAHAVPTTVSFTGRLTTSNGPVSGNVNVTFSLFNQATNGTVMWTETRNNLPANNGLIYADLGSLTTLDESVLANAALFLEIQVGTEVLTPRLPLQSVPYSIRSEISNSADTLGTIAPGDVVTTVNQGNGVNVNRTGNTVTVGLLTTCSANQVLKAGAGGTWNCAADTDTNTTYTAAANSGVVLNTTVFGLMTCSAGQVLKAGATAGQWGCAADTDTDTNTTYSAAANSGVVLNTTAFGLMTCSAGQVLKAGATAGQWGCANDTDTTTTYTGTAPITVSGTTISLATGGVTATHLGASAVAMDEAALPMAFVSQSSGTGTVQGANYIFDPATITPDASGNCLVTSYVETSEATVSGYAYMYVARRQGASDGAYGYSAYMGIEANNQHSATVTTVVPVTAGLAYQFGCYVYISTGSSFIGNSFTCYTSYICT